MIDQFFDKTVSEQWCRAINATLESHTYYPCALLLTVFTEVLGGYVRGTHERRENKENFDAFMKYLGDNYHKISQEINFYAEIRSGLVHEGSPKGEFAVMLSSQPEDELGIGYSLRHDGRKIIDFRLRRYFEDFKKAISKYRKELKVLEDRYQKHKDADELDKVDPVSFELLINFRKAWWYNTDRILKEQEKQKPPPDRMS